METLSKYLKLMCASLLQLIFVKQIKFSKQTAKLAVCSTEYTDIKQTYSSKQETEDIS